MDEKILNKPNMHEEDGTLIDHNLLNEMFKVLLETCTQLTIPIINEMFHTQYRIDEDIQLLCLESFLQAIEIQTGTPLPLTGCYILLGEHKYHIECQADRSYEPLLPMMRCDIHMARLHPKFIDGVCELRHPASAVLYLDEPQDIPDHYQANIQSENGEECMLSFPILKVQEYSIDAIFDKNLLLLLPYYILRFKDQMQEIDSDIKRLKEFKAHYQNIYSKLLSLSTENKVDRASLKKVTILTTHLLKLAAKDTTHIEDIIHMGKETAEKLSSGL